MGCLKSRLVFNFQILCHRRKFLFLQVFTTMWCKKSRLRKFQFFRQCDGKNQDLFLTICYTWNENVDVRFFWYLTVRLLNMNVWHFNVNVPLFNINVRLFNMIISYVSIWTNMSFQYEGRAFECERPTFECECPTFQYESPTF